MSYTFLKGSSLLIDVNGSGYRLYPEAVSFNQTFQETNYSVKTLQERNMIDVSTVQKRAVASFSFVYFISSNNDDDGHIWEWFGLSRNVNDYTISPIVTESPIQRDFYLETYQGKKVKVSGAVIESLEIDTRHDTIAKVAVTGSAKLLETVDSIPALTPVVHSGGYMGNNFLTVEIGGTPLLGITGNSLGIRRTINWLDQPTIHSSEAGEIYVPTIPIQQDLSVSGRYSTVLRDNSIITQNNSVKLISGGLEVYLDNCSITERMETGQWLGKTLDYKLLPTIITEDSYIRYL